MCLWLTRVILGTQEAQIRRIKVQSQLWANSSRDFFFLGGGEGGSGA
jgi:hypothetical protein